MTECIAQLRLGFHPTLPLTLRVALAHPCVFDARDQCLDLSRINRGDVILLAHNRRVCYRFYTSATRGLCSAVL